MHEAKSEHKWIGIVYGVVEGNVVMKLPPAFLKDLSTLIAPLCSPTGTIPLTDLDVIIGKAARVAHVVPHARPFVAGLWGALAAVQRLGPEARREAPPGQAACRRFCYAASWVKALITEVDDAPVTLERIVTPKPPSSTPSSGWSVEFDASIYGGGGILKDPEGIIREYFSVVWMGYEAEHLHVVINDTRHQTFWEFATLLLCLVTWGNRFTDYSLAVLGDNTGSLQNALALKGRGALLAIAREVSWRQARHQWSFTVGHLPSEVNTVADALSRVADPSGKTGWPKLALAGAEVVSPPRLFDIWRAAPL